MAAENCQFSEAAEPCGMLSLLNQAADNSFPEFSTCQAVGHSMIERERQVENISIVHLADDRRPPIQSARATKSETG